MPKADRGGPAGRRAGQYHRHLDSRLLIAAGVALYILLTPAARAQSGLLEARIVAGDGQVSLPGNRLSRPLVVEVTDETGTRVENAVVSFQVPEEGITGTFRNGLRTEILRTDSEGRAQLHGLWMGGLAGQFQVRLTVAKGGARTGILSTQFIAPDSGRRARIRTGVWRPRGRVLEAGAIILAVAAAGYARQSLSGSGVQTVATPPVIGAPTITVGKP